MKRSRFELIHDILDVVNKKGKIKPTHLLYKANLSHKALKQYVGELMEKGILEETMEKRQRYYILTEQGYKFLARYHEFRDFSDAFGI